MLNLGEVSKEYNGNLTLTKLRLTKNEVCYMLGINRDTLSKLEKEYPNFPKSMKEGISRQAAVFYDHQEIIDWYKCWKEEKRGIRVS